MRVALFILFIIFNIHPVFGQDLKGHCARTFLETGICPAGVCWQRCIGGINIEGCPVSCEPIPCFQIAADKCPTDYCDVLDGCNGNKVCYQKISKTNKDCGDLSYPGQEVACCAGYQKRCGMEFFDGTCDMEGKNSVYSVGICIPCGNGICNQFENACNCPEDCIRPDAVKKEEPKIETKPEAIETPDIKVLMEEETTMKGESIAPIASPEEMPPAKSGPKIYIIKPAGGKKDN